MRTRTDPTFNSGLLISAQTILIHLQCMGTNIFWRLGP